MTPEEAEKALEEFLAGRDPRFVCFLCGGNLVEKEVRPDGRKVFWCDNGNCSTGREDGEIVECTICHKPTTLWADDGDVCGGCMIRAMAGEIKLAPDERIGIGKWSVQIEVGGPQPFQADESSSSRN